MSKPDIMKLGDFNRLTVFDSEQGDTVTVEFRQSQQWKMCFEHIRFELDGVVWADPVGYIKVYCEGGQMQTFLVTNGPVKLRGDALPLVFPDDMTRCRVVGALRGFSGAGPVHFKFSLLDAAKKAVAYKRLYLIFNLGSEDGSTN